MLDLPKCSVEDCTRSASMKGMCSMHYKRAWRHGDPNKTLINKSGPKAKCSVAGCTSFARRHGMCSSHSARMSRHGHTDLVRRANGTGAINAAGYVLLTIEGRRVYEHVYVAECALGHKLPEGAVVHHMNEDPADNYTPFNLVICPDQAYHMLLHKRMRDRGYPK